MDFSQWKPFSWIAFIPAKKYSNTTTKKDTRAFFIDKHTRNQPLINLSQKQFRIKNLLNHLNFNVESFRNRNPHNQS